MSDEEIIEGAGDENDAVDDADLNDAGGGGEGTPIIIPTENQQGCATQGSCPLPTINEAGCPQPSPTSIQQTCIDC